MMYYKYLSFFFTVFFTVLYTCNQGIKMELHQHPLWTSDPIPFTTVMSYTFRWSAWQFHQKWIHHNGFLHLMWNFNIIFQHLKNHHIFLKRIPLPL